MPETPPTDAAGLDNFVLLNYYDLPLTEYIAYTRTGDRSFSYVRAKSVLTHGGSILTGSNKEHSSDFEQWLWPTPGTPASVG